MNVNSTSSYVNSASSNKGFSGIASGLDTESMVESMLAGTQAKIDKQLGVKQQIQWKQEIYRDIISQLNVFQNQFFSPSSKNNLLSDVFFNAMNAVTTSKAFNVTATSSAAVGITSLEVRQLASCTSITSGAGVSGKLVGSLDEAGLNQLIKDQLGDEAAYTVKFQVGSKTVEANLRDVFVKGTTFKTYKTPAERDAAIQEKLETAFQGTDVKVSVKDGALALSSAKESVEVAKGSGSIVLQRLGLAEGSRSSASKAGEMSVLSSKVDDVPKLSFSVTLDDLKKDITVDLRKIMKQDGTVDVDALLGGSGKESELQKQLDMAHGSGQIKVKRTGNSFELSVSSGRKVMVGGSKDVLDVIGVKNGQSNRIGMGGALKDLYFANGLQGSSFKFTINGESFSFTGDSTMSDVVNAINRSGAGVRLVYRAQSDTFTLEMSESGAGRKIQMSQTEGNLLNALFGSGAAGNQLLSGGQITSDKLTIGLIPGNPVLSDSAFKVAEGKLTLSVNGTDHTFSLPKRTAEQGGDYDKKAVISELNKQLDEKFGKGNINLTADGGLKVNNGAVVTVKTEAISNPNDKDLVEKQAKGGDLGLALFGVNGGSNEVTGDTTLADLGLSGVKGKDGQILSGTTKLSELSSLTENLSFQEGRIVAKGNGENLQFADAQTMERLFGSAEVDLGFASGSECLLTEGQNAIVKIDGVLTERSSNNFSVNGLNITLKETTGEFVKGQRVGVRSDGTVEFPPEGTYIDESGDVFYIDSKKPVLDSSGQQMHFPSWEFRDSAGKKVENADSMDEEGFLLDADGNRIFEGKAESIEVSRNTDQVVDGIKQFVDAYNKIVKTLNDYLSEEANYSKYPPLTDAQKKEMSEKEIELWEEKAKQGLIRRDPTISTFLQSMRTSLYERPNGCPLALYDLGIETGDWETKGQLVFSEDGEARLRQMIESDPASVMQLFTDPQEGLAVKLNTILDRTAKISSGAPGALVELAGVKGKASEENNSLHARLKDIDERIAALKRTYEKEKTRYWNQFNAMEQMIANMNSQSSWLAQQLGQ